MSRRARSRGKKRGRFLDSRSAAAPATISKYKPGEHYKQRHARRLHTAKETLDGLQKWCDANGMLLKVSNNDHHWRIYRDEDQLRLENQWCEWWPSTAKLVFKKKYANGIHCHDYLQVIAECERELNWEQTQR